MRASGSPSLQAALSSQIRISASSVLASGPVAAETQSRTSSACLLLKSSNPLIRQPTRYSVAVPALLRFDWTFEYRRRAGKLFPLLAIGLDLAEGHPVSTEGLVDTGAELSVFDGAVALSAGIDPTRAPAAVVPLTGFAGGVRRAYLHPAVLYIGSPMKYERLATEVAFTHPGEGNLTFNVLGRRGFLNQVHFGVRDGLIPPELYLTLRP